MAGRRVSEIVRDEELSSLHLPSKRFGAEIEGVLVLDVDGTLTVPGKVYAVDPRAIKEVANFVYRGGSVIICTGATQGRLERTVLVPLVSELESLDQSSEGAEFLKRVYLMPENGAVFLKSDGIKVVENEIHFDWEAICARDLPEKRRLVHFLKTVIAPQYKGSFILDNTCPEEKFRRHYIVSFKGLAEGTPREIIEAIKQVRSELDPASFHGGIPWEKIEMKAARTTIDFVNLEANKDSAIFWALNNLGSLRGPVIGIGDLGDEFAKIVLTINVNQKRPNEFRLRGMPSVDLNGGYELLGRKGWTIVGQGKGRKVLDVETGREIEVLRDEEGKIVFGRNVGRQSPAGNPVIQPCTEDGGGRPLKLLPFVPPGAIKPLEDAGAGAAWIIRRLMEVGYFKPISKPRKDRDF